MKIEPTSRRIAVLLSGRGSNFQAIANQIDQGMLNADIALVLSNKESAAGLEEARRLGLKTAYLPSAGLKREEYDRKAVALLEENDVALVCLAGFMRILSPVFVKAFPLRILNIHPSLLPAFPGLEAQRQALEHGVKFSGCTVHFVDESLDGGPIVRQVIVPVLDGDTVEDLSDRILWQEHRTYSEAIGEVLDGRCEIRDRRVVIDG
jgi:phosphoribosylglycinamide formyltransferase-1